MAVSVATAEDEADTIGVQNSVPERFRMSPRAGRVYSCPILVATDRQLMLAGSYWSVRTERRIPAIRLIRATPAPIIASPLKEDRDDRRRAWLLLGRDKLNPRGCLQPVAKH